MSITVSQNQTRATSGYYIAAGATDSELVINRAIANTDDGLVNIDVGKYQISTPIFIWRDGITLKGAGISSDLTKGTTIYGTCATCPDDLQSITRSKNSKSAYIWTWQVKNIDISYLNFLSDCTGHDGPTVSLTNAGHAGGPTNRECIGLNHTTNVQIHHCYQSKYCYMDFVLSAYNINVEMYNCELWIGHAGYYANWDSKIHCYNNTIHIMTNAAFRISGGSSDVEYDHNYIEGWLGGEAACEVQGLNTRNSFHHNIVVHMDRCTINKVVEIPSSSSPGTGDFKCYKNVIWASGGIDLCDDGSNIRVTDTNQQNQAYWTPQGYGPQDTVVNPGPQCNFTMSPTYGKAPLSVQFTDTSTGTPTAWRWYFGDNATSTTKSPTHNFATDGTYTVSLTVTNANGSNTSSQSVMVGTNIAKPVASFTVSTTNGHPTLSVTFTDTSSNNPTSWQWDFGDGSSSTTESPTHTYTSVGIFNVKLTATNAVGSDISSVQTITVNSTDKPVALFILDHQAGYVPLTVQFTNQSTGQTSSSWNFEDGSSLSTVTSPSHVFNEAGNFPVTVTVTNAGGSATYTVNVKVQTQGNPIADFSASPNSGNAPLTIQFTDSSLGMS